MANVKRKERSPAMPEVRDDDPVAAWGPNLFAPEPDDDDGMIVGGLRLRRGPDGTLAAIVEPQDPQDPA